jgi:Ser/Thr protein kinase RdoA (MazF antagonist)
VDVWAAAAGAIARLHSALASALLLAPEGVAAGLLRQDGDHLRVWMERALAHEAGRGGARLDELRVVAGVHDAVVDELSALPVGVLHGDLYASNVLVVRDPWRVCPVDWETVSLGPTVLDVAALTSGAWSEQDRLAMTTAYRAATPGARLGREHFDRAVDLARMQVCVQWLGWSAGWTAPPEHTHDWLAEAGRLARRLSA